MHSSPSPTDWVNVREALARSGAPPLTRIEAAYHQHVGDDLAIDQIEVFYKTLRKLAQRCDDQEFIAYITRGEPPALVPLTPRELEVLKGAGRSLASEDPGRIASFAAALTRL